MLPQYSRYVVVNSSSQTVTYNSGGRLNLKITGIYFDSANGKVAYEQLSDDDFGFGAGDSLADGAETKTSEIDNTSNRYVGHQVQLEVTHDEGEAADGTFELYLDGGDASGELRSDATGYDDAETNVLRWVGRLKWHSSGLDDELMRSKVINV